jgi:hypothetical protein
MMFRGYIDESGNDQWFTLSCLMARAADWISIESAWKKVLRQKNRELKKSGRKEISRFHTADCSSCVGEFEGWSIPEQIEFSKKLLDIFNVYVTSFVAFTFPIGDFKEVFSEHANDPYPQMYGFLTKFIMLQLVEEIECDGHIPSIPVNFALFHDRTSHDSDLLSAFNHTMNEDQTFDKQKYFSSITSIGWESCVPLQAADLIAYEAFKSIDNQSAGRKPRRSLTTLRKSPNFGGRSKLFSRANLEFLRDGIVSGKSQQT